MHKKINAFFMPEKVMNMLDDLSGINMMGDKLGALTQLKAANAMESMASRPGAANPAMDAGTRARAWRPEPTFLAGAPVAQREILL